MQSWNQHAGISLGI